MAPRKPSPLKEPTNSTKPSKITKGTNPRHPRLRKRKNGLVNANPPRALKAITARNSTSSPLLRLPGELRNLLYTLVFPQSRIWMDTFHAPTPTASSYLSPYPTSPLVGLCPGANLPRTCRQLYAETATLLYARSTFVFWSSFYLRAFVQARIPAQLCALREVELDGWVPYKQTARLTLDKCPNVRICVMDAKWKRVRVLEN